MTDGVASSVVLALAMTAAKRAELHTAAIKLEAKRKQLIHTSDGNDAMRHEVEVLFNKLVEKCEAAKKTGLKLDIGHNSGRCVITNGSVSLVLGWMASGGPGIEYDEFKVFEYKARIGIPGGPQIIYYSERDPQPSKTVTSGGWAFLCKERKDET